MKTEEFEQELRENNFTLHGSTPVMAAFAVTNVEDETSDDDPALMYIRHEGEIVADVDRQVQYRISTRYGAMADLAQEQQDQLYQTLTTYAATPVEDREPDTSYAYRLKDVGLPNCYVNHNPIKDKVHVGDRSDNPDSRTCFTDGYLEQHPGLSAWLSEYADVLETEPNTADTSETEPSKENGNEQERTEKGEE